MGKTIYSAQKAGVPLLQTISSGCKTPALKVKYCNLIKPFYYPNCKIPRFSITCVIDPRLGNEKAFLDFIQSIEKNEKIEGSIKPDYKKDAKGDQVTTGKFMIKFQSKERLRIKVYQANMLEDVKLEDDFVPGEEVTITYDVLRYTKRGVQNEHGLSFKPTEILYHPSESTKKSSLRADDCSETEDEEG